MNKVFSGASDALHDIQDNAVIMLGGFGLCGIPENSIAALATKSMAPPIPFTILPGIFQLAISPFSLTSIAPNTVKSIFPALIIPKLSALSKKAPPGIIVTVSLPAF